MAVMTTNGHHHHEQEHEHHQHQHQHLHHHHSSNGSGKHLNGNGHGAVNGTANGKMNGHGGSFNAITAGKSVVARSRPQETYQQTTVEPGSFFGKLRSLYANQVLKTQLEQLRKQGSYYAFNLEWHPTYEIRRIKDAYAKHDGSPPSLFWESDVAKWLEAACYFLSSPDADQCTHAEEFNAAIEELVSMIEKAQQPDGYLNVYFVVVDPDGKIKNLRDFHELYNAGHLIEAALAHYRYTGSMRFVNVMTKCVEFFAKHIGPHEGQLHGYPGHPEIELALVRLYSLTRNPAHLEFAHYLLEARGAEREDQGGECWFQWEPRQRGDFIIPPHLAGFDDLKYNQSHATLHEQETILGHSVRALYLVAGAADIGGDFLEDARRLWTDAVDNKMYATGGLGSEPFSEGFSEIPHFLPQSTGEGGCYAETCASIACMMVSERLLSYRLDGKYRDVMELCLLNAVLGGGSLDGKQFSYANKQATWGNEVATRCDWFEVCCCPPNLSRTLGMIGGYTWSVNLDLVGKVIELDVYLLLSATRTIDLPEGLKATVKSSSQMPWVGQTQWELSAPEGWQWKLRVPSPEYAENIQLSAPHSSNSGFLYTNPLPASSTLSLTFSLPIRLLAPHLASGKDTLTVSRGPIVYTVESYRNEAIDNLYPHFEGVGIPSSVTFTESREVVRGVEVVMLRTVQNALVVQEAKDSRSYRAITAGSGTRGRTWKDLGEGLTFIPWFARANGGGAGRLRTAFLRADDA